MADGVIHEHFQTAARENQNYHVCLPMDKTNLKGFMYLSVHRSIIYNSQEMEATYVSIDR